MSRTFRNRKSVPHGWVVRDGGALYRYSYAPSEHPPRYRRCIYASESKQHRKPDYQAYRARVRQLVREGRYDDILPYHRTSGWLTW